MSTEGPGTPNDELALHAELALLRKRVEVLETAQRMMHVGVFHRSIPDNASIWTDELRRIYGITSAAPVALETLVAAVHPEDRAAFLALVDRLRVDRTGAIESVRYRIVRPSGELRFLEAWCAGSYAENGELVEIVGTTVDRTDSHLTEQAMRESEARFRMVVAHASDAIFVADEDGRYVEVNEQACALLGYTRDELLARTIMDVTVTSGVPLRFAELRAGKTLHAVRELRRKDGTHASCELTVNMLPDRRMLAVVRDVSDRERAERALRESEQTLRELGANLPLLQWVRDATTGALQFASPGWEPYLGHAPRIGEHFRQLAAALHPESVDAVSRRAQETASETFDEIVRFVHRPSGQVHEFRMRAFAICDENGRAYRVAGIAENVTEQRAAERALRDSEARYRSVVLAMSDGIVVHGPTGEIVTANPSAERMLGLTLDQLQGKTSLDPSWRCIREDGSPFPGDEHPGWVTLHTGKPFTGVIMGVHLPGGDLRWISVNSRRVTELGEEGAYTVVASFTDITERKLADAKILGSLREKEVMLREIHHRVKNNLQVVSSLLGLQAAKTTDPVVAGMFQDSLERLQSMAHIHWLLYQSEDLSRVPFAKYARDIGQLLLRAHNPEAVELLVSEDGNVELGVGIAVPAGLLLHELVSNALKHAFPSGRRGTVHILLAVEPEDRVRIVVSDDGIGLPADLDERSARSLGLRLVDGLVGQLDGGLDHQTTPDAGTTYVLTFSQRGKT